MLQQKNVEKKRRNPPSVGGAGELQQTVAASLDNLLFLVSHGVLSSPVRGERNGTSCHPT